MNNTFSLARLSHLMMNDLRINSRVILIVIAALFVLLLPFNFVGDSSVYFMILYIGGFNVTSFAFSDLHDKQKAYLYLMLPCSNLERFVCRWLMTSIVYAIATLVIYYLFCIFNLLINVYLYHKQVEIFSLLEPDLWLGIAKFIILQSIILLGAIVFKRYVLIKTALAAGCLFLFFNLFLLMISWMHNMDVMLHILSTGWNFIFWIGLAPFCWYITYLRLTEYELT